MYLQADSGVVPLFLPAKVDAFKVVLLPFGHIDIQMTLGAETDPSAIRVAVAGACEVELVGRSGFQSGAHVDIAVTLCSPCTRRRACLETAHHVVVSATAVRGDAGADFLNVAGTTAGMIPEPQIAGARLWQSKRLLNTERIIVFQLVKTVALPIRTAQRSEAVCHNHVPRRDSARSLWPTYLEIVSRQSDGLAVHAEVNGAPVGVSRQREVVLQIRNATEGRGEFVCVGNERLVLIVVREKDPQAGDT